MILMEIKKTVPTRLLNGAGWDGNIQNIFLDFNGNSVIHVCSESNHGDSSENEVKFSRIAVSPVFMPD